MGKTRIELDDVKAICGDTSEASVDDLVDAVFGGNLLETDRFGATLAERAGSALSVALQHVAKLQAMAAQVSPGIIHRQRSEFPTLWNILQAASSCRCPAESVEH